MKGLQIERLSDNRIKITALAGSELADEGTITFTGRLNYKGYNKEPTLVVEDFYLGVFDENDEETNYDDVGDYYKNRILDNSSIVI